MKNNGVLAALIGGAFFTIPYIALSIPVLPSLAIGVAAFCAGDLVLRSKDNNSLEKKDVSLYNKVQQAKKQNQRIINISSLIEDEDIKKKLIEINVTVSKIISTIEKYPDKVKKTHNFFEYYLPVTVKIVERYEDIENQKLNSKDSKKFKNATNEMIIESNKVFNKILNNLYRADMVGIDVEMKVFDTMLKADGFDNDCLTVDSEEDNNE